MRPGKTLFITEGQLGDLLLLTPALRAMKTSFPSGTVSILVLERRKAIISPLAIGIEEEQSRGTEGSVFEGNPNVDEIFFLDRDAIRSVSGLRRVRAELSVINFLRGKKFDAIICTFPEDRFVLWAYVSGAKVRVGQRRQPLHWLLTHRPDTQKGGRGVLDYYCDLVRSVGASLNSRQTEFFIPESSRRWATDFFKSHQISAESKAIAIHPGATGNYKIWPPDCYSKLIKRLSSERGIKVILCYGVHDVPIVSAIKSMLNIDLIEANTGDHLGNLAALLTRCALCITNDSGPRHLAAAVGIPSLAFFRQFHDREWKIYAEDEAHATLQGRNRCPACPESVCLDKVPEGERFGAYCLRMIGVDEALERILQLLSKNYRWKPRKGSVE